ncbi:MAG TPA: hypothetical protein VK874_03890 [Gaiellaceae bacterium]|nr:hypothetical protein [Gaiellaceae bacterium]
MNGPPLRPRASDAEAGGRFRHTLVDLAGRDVGEVECDEPLRADDVVVLGAGRGAVQWRVVGMLGTCATVTRDDRT